VASTTSAAKLGHEQVRGSSLLLVGRVLSVVFTMAAQVLVVRALSKTEYGAFAYALAIVSACRILLSLGTGKILSRFMTIYSEQRDYGRMFGAMIVSGVTVLLTGSAVVVGFAFAAPTVVSATVDHPDAVDILLVLVLLAPLEALDQVFVSLFAVFTRPRSIFFRKYLLTPALRLAVVIALVLLDEGAVFLAVGYVVTQAIGIGVYVALLHRLMREQGLLAHFKWRQLRFPVKSLFGFSLPTLTGELMYLSMNTASVVMLGLYRGAAEIAGYRAVFPLARMNQFVFSSFVTLYLPMAARLFARGDHNGSKHTYWHTAVFLAVLSYPVFAMTTVFAHTTTGTLFGQRYADSAVVLAVLSAGFYFNAALGFNTYTLQVYGRLRWLLVVNFVAAGLNVALALLLIPAFGALGVAAANCATLVVQNVCNQIALRSTIGSAFVDRANVRPYLVILAATLVLTGFQLWLSPGFIAAIVLTGVVWLAVLFTTRRWLQLGETFPELVRVPGVRLLVR
jgi:O-antigen/teichoic acid export membrane protein